MAKGNLAACLAARFRAWKLNVRVAAAITTGVPINAQGYTAA